MIRRACVTALVIAAAGGNAVARGAEALDGAALYEARCGGCHDITANRIGPRHAGLAGRKAGALADFDYSPALRASSVMWSAATLDRWLQDPEALIPGQRMGYRLSSPAERDAIIRYLLTR